MNIFKKLDIKYPIIQGAMANIATADFASKVCLAGGLGVIATGGYDKNQAKNEIIKMKELVGDLNFGVNLMLMSPFCDDIVDLCIEYNVAVVTTGAGNPARYIKRLHENNILVIPIVPSVTLAKKMVKYGADAIVAEGTESGGHVGEITTMVLAHDIANNVDIDVIAAGGISSNKQFLAALSLGCVGVQIGTILLCTKECPVHQVYKEMIIDAKDTSTIVTGRSAKVPVRALKNKMTKKYKKLESSQVDPHELEVLTLGSLKKAVFDGDKDNGSFMAGQVSGSIKCESTISQVFESLVNVDEELKLLIKKVEQL